jgi:hypothetical protein
LKRTLLTLLVMLAVAIGVAFVLSGRVAAARATSAKTFPDDDKFDAAAPVGNAGAPTRADVRAGTTYAGPALQFMHVGPHDRLGTTIDKAFAWAAVHGYKPKDRLMEEYLSDPGATPPDQMQTRVTIPVE